MNTDQNAARQAPYCANTPPIAGPPSVATPQAAEVSDKARDHSASSNSVRTMRKGQCRQRAGAETLDHPTSSNTGMEGAKAHTNVPSAKTGRATR